MLRAAVYARKSTEQNVADDAKSVTRQVELARAFAVERGWTVDDAHVYTDNGVSGVMATKLIARARMLAAAAEEQFSILVVRDLDRLSRDDEEFPGLIRTLREAGVAVWCYADGQRVESGTAMQRGMTSMKAIFASAEREAAQSRTREAMRAKATRGHVAGGKVFGYTNTRDASGVHRIVNDTEANVIRRLFTLCADGLGLLRIAKALNAERVPSPTGHGWAASGVREMLHRALYRGQIVYGKTQWVYKQGGKRKVDTSEAEWITVDAPELRIVSDALWKAAQERMAKTHEVYLRHGAGLFGGKPESGLQSHYLLSGFLQCGVCGGNLVISRKTGPRGPAQTTYICAMQRTRGREVCSNKYGVSAIGLANAVLAQLSHVFLNPAALGTLLMHELKTNQEAPEALAQQRHDVAAQMTKLDTELGKLGDAIAAGEAPQTLLLAIKSRETERQRLQATLEHLDGLAIEAGDDFDVAAWLEETKGLLGNLRETLGADPAAGRQVLRRLLVGPITVTPRVEDGRLAFDFAGKSSYAEFAGAPGADLVLGAPAIGTVNHDLTGTLTRAKRAVSDVWCPRGDSNTRPTV